VPLGSGQSEEKVGVEAQVKLRNTTGITAEITKLRTASHLSSGESLRRKRNRRVWLAEGTAKSLGAQLTIRGCNVAEGWSRRGLRGRSGSLGVCFVLGSSGVCRVADRVLKTAALLAECCWGIAGGVCDSSGCLRYLRWSRTVSSTGVAALWRNAAGESQAVSVVARDVCGISGGQGPCLRLGSLAARLPSRAADWTPNGC
jgi:hypothetical protein